MSTIHKIYSNALGMSFFWKKGKETITPKIQVVFKDVGFLLTINELKDFSSSCFASIQSLYCQECPHQQQCNSLLLRTPSNAIDLAVSKEELYQIHELLNETIFKVELQSWIKNWSLN